MAERAVVRDASEDGRGRKSGRVFRGKRRYMPSTQILRPEQRKKSRRVVVHGNPDDLLQCFNIKFAS